MNDLSEQEFIDLEELDPESWNEFATAQGWSDGLPLAVPGEATVERFVARCRGDNRPLPPISPRQVVPTLTSLAANAVMAGCREDYFPAVVAALRTVLDPDYNLHGMLATTHSCSSMVLFNGPVRDELGINCSSNCFGQGWRANATIGRALQLILLNVGGARPGEMDRSTQGNPAKFSFCFGENEEQSPWAPYHVRRGFDAGDNVVTTMAAEGPHNINDHGSTSGKGLLTTIAATLSSPGANTIYGKGPLFLVLGPEHAQTLHRDGYGIESMQAQIYEDSRVHVNRVSTENHESYVSTGQSPVDDHFYIVPSPEAIHIVVAGGEGKHSAFIPSFGGTATPSVQFSL